MSTFVKLDSFMTEQLERYSVPSLTYAVIKDKDVIHTASLGMRDLKSRAAPDGDTRYPICSLTKSMTSFCLGMLSDEGKIDFEAPVREYLPGFGFMDAYATNNATLRDMLTHMTGLPRHNPVTFKINEAREPLECTVSRIASLPANKGFRSRFEYVNLMYMTLALIIERVSGKTYADFIEERLFRPLGMASSSARTRDMINLANRARPYSYDVNGAPLETLLFDNDALSGAGNVNSTILDMAKYMAFNISGVASGGERLLSARCTEEIFSTQAIDWYGPGYKWAETPVACYGYGWTIQPYRGRLCMCHAGSIYGFTSYMAFLPYEKLGIVALSNLEQSFLPFTVTHHVFDECLGLAAIDWEARYQANRDATGKAIAAHNNALVEKLFAEAKHERAALDEFLGCYYDPGYGDAEVVLRDGRLILLHGGWEYPLNAAGRMSFTLDIGRPDRKLLSMAEFILDDKHEVTALDVKFELSLEKPIRFMRKV